MRMTVLSLQHSNKQPVISNCILRLRGPEGPSRNASDYNKQGLGRQRRHLVHKYYRFQITITTITS